MKNYSIYTTAFDEVVNAQDLTTEAELKQLNKAMETLCLRLLSKISPTPEIKSKFNTSSLRNSHVTVLLDNSGSLRGRPLSFMLLTTNLLGDLFAKAGVPFEVIGFTTTSWKGGEMRKKWLKAGRPKNPGRLAELRHIIYKDVKTPWKQARQNLALMMKDGLLKENIDGEALKWALERSMTSSCKRKIIVPISDGAPIDESTLNANNDPKYLINHLHQVIAQVKAKNIELFPVGIKYDTSPSYLSSCGTITNEQSIYQAISDLMNAMTSPKTQPNKKYTSKKIHP